MPKQAAAHRPSRSSAARSDSIGSVVTGLSMLALRGGSLDPADGVTLPSRLVILPWGTHDLGKRGLALCDDTTVATFEAAMAALKFNDEVFLDFNHNSLPGHAAYLAEKEPRLKAARGVPKILPGEGIVLEALTWTPEGADAFRGGHFQDISPVIFRNAANHVIAIHSAALCDHGEVDGLTIEAATAPPELAAAFAALSVSLSPRLPVSQSPSLQVLPLTTTPPMHPDILKALAALLAGLEIELPEAADDATIATALTSAAGKIDAMKAPPADMMKKEEVKPDALSLQITDLTARLAQVEKEKDQNRRDALMADAVRDGKLIPLSTDLWNAAPVAVCEGLVAQAQPGAVPLQKKTPEGEQSAATPEALSAETEAVLNQMGLSKDDFAKYGPNAAVAA